MEEKSILSNLRDGDPYKRRLACEAIEESKDEAYVPHLIKMLYDANPGVREASVNALVSIGGKPVAEAVAPLLRERDVVIRNLSIEILEQIGIEAIDVIIPLLGDGNDDVVKHAVDILSHFDAKKAGNALLPLITHHNPNVRASVALCLGKTKVDGALKALKEALHDREEWVRFSTVEGLGYLGDIRALEPLLTIVEMESGVVREAAIDAIGKIVSPKDAPSVLSKLEDIIKKDAFVPIKGVVDILDKTLSFYPGYRLSDASRDIFFKFFSLSIQDNDWLNKKNAIRGFALLGERRAIRDVINFLNTLPDDLDEDTEEFFSSNLASIVGEGPLPEELIDELKKGSRSFRIIVRALARIGTSEILPLFGELLASLGKEEIREILKCIEAIGSKDSVEILFKSLKSKDGHVRKIAARALAGVAGRDAIESLFEALRVEKYRDVKEGIVFALSTIPDESVTEGFVQLLSDGNDELRELACTGLGLRRDEKTVEHLRKVTTDRNPRVRKEAYRALTAIAIPEVMDVLAQGLRDEDDEVRLSILKSLNAGFANEKIKETLKELLRDKNLWVRYHAVRVLAEMRAMDAEDVILDLLSKDEPPVKVVCAKALEEFGSTKAIDVLKKLCKHPNPTVRGAVTSAIEAIRCL